MDDDPDPVLHVLGPDLVQRCLNGELGVFAGVDVQMALLDAALLRERSHPGEAAALRPLLQLFQDTKAPRVRSHKLERLAGERSGGSVAPAPASPVSSQPSPPPPSLETATPVPSKLYYLINESACVRVRSRPSVELGEAIDLVDFNNNVIDVRGVSDNWFQVRLAGQDRLGWVIRRGGGQDLFAPVPEDSSEEEEERAPAVTTVTIDAHAFHLLLDRVTKLELELSELKSKLRQI